MENETLALNFSMAVEHFTWPLVMPPVFWPVSGSLIVLLKVSTSSLYNWTQLLSVCPVLNSTFNSWAFPRFNDFHHLASLTALLPDSCASTSLGLLKCISSGLPFFQSLWFSSLLHHFLLSCFPCGAIQFHLLWVDKSTSRNKCLHGTVPLFPWKPNWSCFLTFPYPISGTNLRGDLLLSPHWFVFTLVLRT